MKHSFETPQNEGTAGITRRSFLQRATGAAAAFMGVAESAAEAAESDGRGSSLERARRARADEVAQETIVRNEAEIGKLSVLDQETIERINESLLVGNAGKAAAAGAAVGFAASSALAAKAFLSGDTVHPEASTSNSKSQSDTEEVVFHPQEMDSREKAFVTGMSQVALGGLGAAGAYGATKYAEAGLPDFVIAQRKAGVLLSRESVENEIARLKALNQVLKNGQEGRYNKDVE